MFRPLLLAAAASIALAACATDSEMAADTAAASGDMTPNQRSAYVEMAAASDLYEIQSSQLATSKAQNADVRAFAQMLIDNHTMTTQQLTAAATSAGTPPTPHLMPMQERMIADLQGASGGDFDRMFLR